jgi:hypothetical protein
MNHPWKISSDPKKGLLLAIGCFVVGCLILWMAGRIPTQDSNTLAGIWLGALLAGLGLAGVILDEVVSTTVHPNQKFLEIDSRRRWGKSRVVISFDEIASINVVRVGDRTDGTPTFWLQIERQDRKRFFTGGWSTSEREMGFLAERLAEEIGCDRHGGNPPNPASVGQVASSLIGAVILYVMWYRLVVGDWCMAMWFGTFPPIFLLLAFSGLLLIFRSYRPSR